MRKLLFAAAVITALASIAIQEVKAAVSPECNTSVCGGGNVKCCTTKGGDTFYRS